jgi:hypothetical protein
MIHFGVIVIIVPPSEAEEGEDLCTVPACTFYSPFLKSLRPHLFVARGKKRTLCIIRTTGRYRNLRHPYRYLGLGTRYSYEARYRYPLVGTY